MQPEFLSSHRAGGPSALYLTASTLRAGEHPGACGLRSGMGEGLDCHWVGLSKLAPQEWQTVLTGQFMSRGVCGPREPGTIRQGRRQGQSEGTACTRAGPGDLCAGTEPAGGSGCCCSEAVGGGGVGGVEGTHHSLDSVVGPGVDYKPRSSSLKREPSMITASSQKEAQFARTMGSRVVQG